MNDYFAGALARERQADYQREVDKDHLAALAHATAKEQEADPTIDHRPDVPAPARHRWWRAFQRRARSGLIPHAHRP